jgi:hypothetical protein
MSFYARLVLGAIMALVFAACMWGSYKAGRNAVIAEEVKTRTAITEALDNSRKGTADAIAELKPQVQIINQKVREVVRTVPVYRECVHAPGVLEDINRALTGGPVGGGVLPPVDPAK